MNDEYASPEKIAVAWVRAQEPLVALIGSRCATRLPADPTFPFLIVREIDTGPMHRGVAVTRSLLQFDAYGDVGDLAGAEAVALELIRQAEQANGHRTEHGLIMGLRFGTKRPIEEPQTGWARYLVELTMTARRR